MWLSLVLLNFLFKTSISSSRPRWDNTFHSTSLSFVESSSSNSILLFDFSKASMTFFFWKSSSLASFSFPVCTLIAACRRSFSAASDNRRSLNLALFAESTTIIGLKWRHWVSSIIVLDIWNWKKCSNYHQTQSSLPPHPFPRGPK